MGQKPLIFYMADKKYLGLDFSTWVTIITQFVTIVFFIGVYVTTIRNHSEHLDTLDIKIAKIEDEVARNVVQLTTHHQIIDSLVLRANKLETALNDISVLKNDMDWLKRFLIAKEGEVSKK